MRRPLILSTLFALVLGLAVPVSAAEPPPSSFDPSAIVFPLEGSSYHLTKSFGDCRDGCARSHEGVDIMADKGTPVIAVAPGKATWVSDSERNCCRLGIDHGNGWETRYLHLNNDSENPDGSYSDDGKGWGIAEGIVNGAQVEAGEVIGWVGDSGNAESTSPHLHFEIRKDGSPIDPYPHLLRAAGAWVGQFSDDDDSVHHKNIDKIYAAGITVGCNPPANDRFCPKASITRGQMAAFLARALDLTETSGSTGFDDLGGHQFEAAVDKIMTAGIGFGCDANSFCPDRPLLRDEMAEMLVRAFSYENPDKTDFFVDDNGNRFEESINKLAAAGITVGCNPPSYDSYCPTQTLSRGEMATFFVRVGAS